MSVPRGKAARALRSGHVGQSTSVRAKAPKDARACRLEQSGHKAPRDARAKRSEHAGQSGQSMSVPRGKAAKALRSGHVGQSTSVRAKAPRDARACRSEQSGQCRACWSLGAKRS